MACNLFTLRVFNCQMTPEDEDICLADDEIFAALDRKDELGRLVSSAFSFELPPFCEVFADLSACLAGDAI